MYRLFLTWCLAQRCDYSDRFCKTQKIKSKFDRENISGLFDIVMVAIYSSRPSMVTTMKPRDFPRDFVVPVSRVVKDAADHPSSGQEERQTTLLPRLPSVEARINCLLFYWSSCLFNGDQLCFSPQILSLPSFLIFCVLQNFRL